MKNIYRFLPLFVVLSFFTSGTFVALAQNSQPTCSIVSDRASYLLNDRITLSWDTANSVSDVTYAAFQQNEAASILSLSGEKLTANGSRTATANTTGRLIVTLLVYNYKGVEGSCSTEFSISAPPSAPTLEFNAYPTTINPGQNAVLAWRTENATRCVLQSDFQEEEIDVNGKKIVSPSRTTSYRALCVNQPPNDFKDGPSTEKTVTVYVANDVSSPPSCKVMTDQSSYNVGENIKIFWGSTSNTTYAAFQQNEAASILSLSGEKLTANGSITAKGKTEGELTLTLLVYSQKGTQGSCSTEFSIDDEDKRPDTDTEPFQGCLMLKNNLRYGSRDSNTNNEVSGLQFFLQFAKYFKFEPTGYFGLLTYEAVKKFQLKVLGNGFNTGFVGPLTRKAIEDLTCRDLSRLVPTY